MAQFLHACLDMSTESNEPQRIQYSDAPFGPVQRHLTRLEEQLEIALVGDGEGKRGLFGRPGSPGYEGMLADYPTTRDFAHRMSVRLAQLYETQRQSPHVRLKAQREARKQALEPLILALLEQTPERALKRNKNHVCEALADVLNEMVMGEKENVAPQIRSTATKVIDTGLFTPNKTEEGIHSFSSATFRDYFKKAEIDALIEQSKK